MEEQACTVEVSGLYAMKFKYECANRANMNEVRACYLFSITQFQRKAKKLIPNDVNELNGAAVTQSPAA